MRKSLFMVALVLVMAPPCQGWATTTTPARVESAFSPDADAEALVIKVINASTASIRLAAYSFSSPPVVDALLAARQRGVDVQVLIDYRRNQHQRNFAALDRLVGAGIPTRTISVYAMHHDKYMVADERTLQNGSFNYTRDAATANSENVTVHWDNPELAQAFLRHWENRWAKGVNYQRRP